MSKYKKTNAEKKRGHLVFLMFLIITLCVLIVAGIWAISEGYLVLPKNFVNTQSPSIESSARPTPPKDTPSSKPVPPKLTVNNRGGELNEDSLSSLRELLAQKPFSISLYYQNLSNGTEIEFNSKKQYGAGSVVKAPFCKWLLTQNPNLDEEILFTKESIVEGAGEIQKAEPNTPFTVRQLIEAMIVKSDNTAYNMAIQRFGLESYVASAKALGVSANQSKKNIFGNMSAAGAAILFKDIYFYEIEFPEQSALLLDFMKDTDYFGLIPTALKGTPVAHKYGYNGGNYGFHDAGIIYSEQPYVLTVFTTLDYEQKGTEEYIRSVVTAVDKLHNGN